MAHVGSRDQTPTGRESESGDDEATLDIELEECATETPTAGTESQDSFIIRDIVIESDEKPPHDYETKQKSWVDKEDSRSNSFKLSARELSITWGDDARYWRWSTFQEDTISDQPVAELIRVCWFEIHAKFDTTKLTPGRRFQVAFEIKMEEHGVAGWDYPVNLRLFHPDGLQKQKVDFKLLPRRQWIKVPVGDFLLNPGNNNKAPLEISMYEYEGGNWKTGLAIKGVVIEPKIEQPP